MEMNGNKPKGNKDISGKVPDVGIKECIDVPYYLVRALNIEMVQVMLNKR